MATEETNDLQARAVEAQEERARGEGWVPIDDWGGDPGDWVGAAEFNIRGELMKRIQTQTRGLRALRAENEALNKAIKDLSDHNKRIAESDKKSLLKELRKERRTAHANEDFDLADEIDEKIDEVKEIVTQEDHEASGEGAGKSDELTAAQMEVVKQEFGKFLKDNSWYGTDPALKQAADEIGQKLMTDNPEYLYDPETYYADVAKAVKKQEAKAFAKGNAAGEVTEPGGNRSNNGAGKKKYTVRDLNEEQRAIAKRFVATGAFAKEQEYVDQLAAMGEFD